MLATIVARRASALCARSALVRSAAPAAFATAARRSFASNPIEATAKLYEDLVDKSVKEFQANQKEVSDNLDAELKSNKVVLFMEGTVDAPKSEPSMNAVKILTQAQVVPLTAIDVLAHPAILGYT
ncbi:unnamed protein product, partial [Polarella glacialis]